MDDGFDCMFDLTTQTPGLFITATGTAVGKTVATCAIAAALRQRGLTVGVCKPLASGCRREREHLVNADAEALAHFADCRFPLNTINPIRYRPPVAPAGAIEAGGPPLDEQVIADSINTIADACDLMLVEGVGGVMVPLDDKRTVLDLAAAIGYPVVVVAGAELGTLNHTAMTCALLRQRGLKLAGIVLNRYQPDSPDPAVAILEGLADLEARDAG